jgi:hypothetical protein
MPPTANESFITVVEQTTTLVAKPPERMTQTVAGYQSADVVGELTGAVLSDAEDRRAGPVVQRGCSVVKP